MWESGFERSPQSALADLQNAFATFDSEVHGKVNVQRAHDPCELIFFYHDNLNGNPALRTLFEHRQDNWFKIDSDVWGSLEVDPPDIRLPNPENIQKLITAAGIYLVAAELLEQGQARVEIVFN